MPSYLSFAGLFLNFVGAALLAYDTIYGPVARRDAAQSRGWLTTAQKWREEFTINTRALTPLYSNDDIDRILGSALPRMDAAITKAQTDVEYHEQHESRAQARALLGMLSLTTGFFVQLLALVAFPG
jgi:hypothetical protein